MSVSVFPHDTNQASDPTESRPSANPFFTASFHPIRWLPSFPLSLSLARLLGFDLTLVHPPLPEGCAATGELAGTSEWCAVSPIERSRRARLGWFNLRQGDGSNFWPGWGRWKLGVVMEDTDFVLGCGRKWPCHHVD